MTPRTDRFPVHGVLLLDKPLGLSSSQALQRVRRMLGAAKAGHTGALDPLATGMLPLCFGEATKIAGVLLESRKAYRAECRLGITTTTDDAEGKVVQTRPVTGLDRQTVETALQGFMGRLTQVPPVYSALKLQGQPLYRRARRGETVEVPARTVEVHALKLIEIAEDRLVLEVECGSGFYVRALARDLGERLGCGAHLSALRRLWVAPFLDRPMRTLEALEQRLDVAGREALQASLLGIADALPHWPRWVLDAQDSLAIQQGRGVTAPAQAAAGSCLLFDPGGRPLALATVHDGRFMVERGFNWDVSTV